MRKTTNISLRNGDASIKGRMNGNNYPTERNDNHETQFY